MLASSEMPRMSDTQSQSLIRRKPMSLKGACSTCSQHAKFREPRCRNSESAGYYPSTGPRMARTVLPGCKLLASHGIRVALQGRQA